MTLWALVTISYVFNGAPIGSKTYYATEYECGVASDAVAARLAKDRPKGNVVYFCQEQVDTSIQS